MISGLQLRRMFLVLSMCVAAPGCGAGNQAARRRVAVFPLDGVGLPAAKVAQMRSALSRRIGRFGDLTVVDRASVDRALRALCGEAPTAEAVDCASRVGRQLRATHVVLGAMGGLGSTYVLNLRLVSVRRQAVTRSLEETVFGARRDQATVLSDLAQRLFGVRSPPWYQRWWVWSTAAAAVAAAIAVPLAVRDDDPYRDIHLP